MSCSPFDLRDYFFGDLDRAQQVAVDSHVKKCDECREELDSLRLTQGALLTLREEEPPRRIAFVSDPVFEPNWFVRLWRSGPQLGFISAALLSGAILVHALAPRQQPTIAQVQTPMRAAQPASVVPASSIDTQRLIETAVQKAVSESEARQSSQFQQILAKQQHGFDLQHKATMAAVAEYTDVMQRRMNVIYRASAQSPLEQAQ